MHFYGLIGNLSAKKGKGDQLVKLLIEASKILEGHEECIQYIIAQESNNKDIIWVTEIWTSKKAHDASLQLPAIKSIIAEAMPIIEETNGLGAETVPIGGVAKNPFVDSKE
ncbi:putative quinol monooxygenase [Salibacter halophilus]|uniref:Antibiotic biosynthesis monooxygenase n=1 Tax=Salibacter halophilus TaxID=1803916 RepID=A0A6N6MA35_9FLAO|nr:antibiotic biosynthesis monooxygenase [Salibacter halophilus]KAB1065110.1 antibiotic biosynthesis monooxygenase [Salibacter halophilus]